MKNLKGFAKVMFWLMIATFVISVVLPLFMGMIIGTIALGVPTMVVGIGTVIVFILTFLIPLIFYTLITGIVFYAIYWFSTTETRNAPKEEKKTFTQRVREEREYKRDGE